MSDLPPPVSEAGLLFRQTSITNDAEAMRQVIAWGHQQIDVAYPEDPIRAPLNVVRRRLAHMEWDRVIRTQGRDLRGMIANSIVRDLEFEIKRRQDRILAEEAEEHRQRQLRFDGTHAVRQQEAMNEIAMRMYEAQKRLDHELQQDAEDAASRRRIKEEITKTEQLIATLTAEAIIKSMGSSSATKILEATQLVNDEIARIRRNPELTEDDKHLQIKVLLETLPHLLRNLRPQDV